MEISQSVYGIIFIYSVIIGMALGVIYDVFRIQRITMRVSIIKDIIIFIEDILFSVTAAVIIIIMIFHVNHGRIRWFALFGSGLGIVLYYNTIGRIVMLCSEKIIAFIQYCIRAVKRFIKIIFIKPLTGLNKLVGGFIYKRYIQLKNKLYTKKYIACKLNQRWNRC